MVGGVESGGKEARELGKEVGWEDLATASLEKGRWRRRRRQPRDQAVVKKVGRISGHLTRALLCDTR